MKGRAFDLEDELDASFQCQLLTFAAFVSLFRIASFC